MGNFGKRSRCCFKCRERRIKCDMQFPHCRRCRLLGQECPGYPEAWDVSFRMQNEYAEGKVQTRVKKAKAVRMEHSKTVAVSIPQGVYLAVELHSWNRFYHDYIVDSGIAAFNFLPEFHTGDSPVYLREALQAVTVASAAQQLQQSELMVRARSHYGKAIVKLNTALNDQISNADDSVLITLFLLSLFETVVPGYFRTVVMDKTFQCHIHVRGILSILRLRVERAQKSELDEAIFTFICHIYVMRIFINFESCDQKWLALESFVTPWTSGPLLEPVLRRAVDFVRHAHSQLTAATDCHSEMEILSLVSEGIRLSEDLEAAAAKTRSSSYTSMSSHQFPKAFNNMFGVSTKHTEAISRSSYRTVRYRVVEMAGELISLISNESDSISQCFPSQFDFLERTSVLEMICGDIVAVLGCGNKSSSEQDSGGMAYRAYGMFWPMVVLLFSPSVGLVERTWIQERLRGIGKTTGLGLAAWAADAVNSFRPTSPMIKC